MTRPVVLFDIDGTLTDTNYLHVLAWRRAFLDRGHDVAAWRIHQLIGASGSRLMTDLIGAPDDGVKASWREHFEALAPEIRPFPESRALVACVRERGARAVLATSSPADLVQHHLDALGVEKGDVDGITTDGDVENAKPDPEVFRTALSLVDGDPTRALVIGDTGWDVDAAVAAGVEAIGVRSGGWTARDLTERGAIEVHDDVAAQLALLPRSALGDLLRG